MGISYLKMGKCAGIYPFLFDEYLLFFGQFLGKFSHFWAKNAHFTHIFNFWVAVMINLILS